MRRNTWPIHTTAKSTGDDRGRTGGSGQAGRARHDHQQHIGLSASDRQLPRDPGRCQIVGFIDTLIAIRFLLKLFGANQAPLVRFMYDVTWPFVAPIHGIFNTDQVGRSVFEPESLVAIGIDSLAGWAIVSLIRIVSGPRATTTVVE